MKIVPSEEVIIASVGNIELSENDRKQVEVEVSKAFAPNKETITQIGLPTALPKRPESRQV